MIDSRSYFFALASLLLLSTSAAPLSLASDPAHSPTAPAAPSHPVDPGSVPKEEYTNGFRCNAVGNYHDVGNQQTYGVGLNVCMPISGTNQGLQLLKTGIEHDVVNVTSKNIEAAFCVSDTLAEGHLLMEEDSSGVPRAAFDGKIVCHGEIRHDWTLISDPYVEFIGNGFRGLDHNKTSWRTYHDFQVLNIRKGTLFHDIIKKCQGHTLWTDMQREAEKAQSYPYFLMRQFGKNVECLKDEHCPGHITNEGGLGYIDDRKVARCVVYSDKETRKIKRYRCENFANVGEKCDSRIKTPGKRADCDWGLECRYDTWTAGFGDDGVFQFQSIYRCVDPKGIRK